MDGFDNQGRKGTAFAPEKLEAAQNRGTYNALETMPVAGCLLSKRV
jgi:hypothetical protein